MGSIDGGLRAVCLQTSPFFGVYDEAIDRESAYELLAGSLLKQPVPTPAPAVQPAAPVISTTPAAQPAAKPQGFMVYDPATGGYVSKQLEGMSFKAPTMLQQPAPEAAPAAPETQQMPVMVFNPATGQYTQQMMTMRLDPATGGYIAVQPEQTAVKAPSAADQREAEKQRRAAEKAEKERQAEERRRRADELRERGTFAQATEFYRAHRAEMDEGAVVSWPARHNYDEISAIQHAMNLKLTDEAAFWAEYQNEPLPEDLGTDEQLTTDGVVNRLNGHSRGAVPVSANHVTMFVDVQKTLLFYVVCAWDDDFTGYVLDYGAWPDQRRRYFTLSDANPTLQARFPRAGLEGCIHGGLKSLTDDLLSREFTRDDGAAMKVERCLVDANWGQSTDVVYQFCRESAFANVLLPSHGKYIGASSKPMGEYRKVPGDRVGCNWRMPNIAGRRTIRHVVYDTNFWKSFVASRILTSPGDRGSLTLWGRSAESHLLLAEHLTAEYRVKTEGRGRRVEEWRDNHWWDGLVGCAVAASMCGCVLAGMDRPSKKVERPKMKLSELRRTRNL